MHGCASVRHHRGNNTKIVSLLDKMHISQWKHHLEIFHFSNCEIVDQGKKFLNVPKKTSSLPWLQVRSGRSYTA